MTNWLAYWPEGRAFRVIPEIGIAFGTDKGPSRDNNQDRAVVIKVSGQTRESSLLCAVVCDGMGGMRDGAACASIAIGAFVAEMARASEILDQISLLEAALHSANESVHHFARGGGGTTLSALLVTPSGRGYWLNVGDSRVYGLFKDGKDFELRKITTDDNMQEAFGGRGTDLVQFVGIGAGIVPHTGQLDSRASSALITTDGIHSIEPRLLSLVYENAPNFRSGTERLLAAANWVSGADNGTIVGLSLKDAQRSLRLSEDVGSSGMLELWKPAENGQVTVPIFWEEPRRTRTSARISATPKTTQAKPKRQRTSKRKAPAEQLEIDVNYERKPNNGDNS
ncbi:PP2C family protein-serine/threonine phosphatase [Taklimakanibacter deserti]|uniref:PP2C family protein-serine/threonine phosphatase n=1 Tax=Taklimakanibacter deserti TaxID=2267839 RepID=UPI0013C493CB